MEPESTLIRVAQSREALKPRVGEWRGAERQMVDDVVQDWPFTNGATDARIVRKRPRPSSSSCESIGIPERAAD